MSEAKKPIANQSLVFREEFDDWAVLFDPDSGEAYGLDPVGAFLWKRLDGAHGVDELVAALRDSCEDKVPEEAHDHVAEFLAQLDQKGYVGYA
ncbi:MAG: SynChlorMet cassette protein ScmD [Planctomycetota bacterium]